MQKFQLKEDPRVDQIIRSYPAEVQKKLNHLRKLILEVAKEEEFVDLLEETVKWGEPSYMAKKGSTIRMDWKPKNPDQYALFFNCNTSLVETFRIIYGPTFSYEKNRAIWFDLHAPLPEKEVKACIAMALNYHLLKHKPFLGN